MFTIVFIISVINEKLAPHLIMYCIAENLYEVDLLHIN